MSAVHASLTDVLSPEEIRRRIVAARELNGMTQEKLGALVEQEGYGKHDIGRLERMDEQVVLTPGRRAALVKHLKVPEAWFTADRDDLFSEIGDGADLKLLPESMQQLVEGIAGRIRDSIDDAVQSALDDS